jgi:hypothetical protein
MHFVYVDCVWGRPNWNLNFHKNFAIIVCETLEMQFKDNHIIDTFEVLRPTNMPILASWIEPVQVGEHENEPNNTHIRTLVNHLCCHIDEYKCWRLFVLIMECHGIFIVRHFYL